MNQELVKNTVKAADSPSSKDRPNFKRLKHGVYVVRTQAGFNQATRDFDTGNEQVFGYPASYPSVVFLSRQYEGYFYTSVRAIHVNEFKEFLKDE